MSAREAIAVEERHTLSSPRPADARHRPWRLGARSRKATLVLHIASAGTWLGMDIVMGVVVLTAVLTDSEATKALCYQVLELFAIWPLLTTGLVCLATGVLLGLGSKYGLITYWWVAVKLGLNLLLTSLIVVLLRPGVQEIAERGRDLQAGGTDVTGVGDLAFPPIVSTTLVLTAIVLSVFKPWGRIRERRADRSTV